jgi:hypothetical protein
VNSLHVGNLTTVNEDIYPSLKPWWTQIWQGDHVIARVYGDTPEESRELASLIVKALAEPIAIAIAMAQREHDLSDVRCGNCGYMTYHREHMGCIRAAKPAPVARKPLTDEQINTVMPNPSKLFEDDNNIVLGYTSKQIREVVHAVLALRNAEPVARVAEVHMSRYTVEWTNGPLPEGTPLYAAPAPVAQPHETDPLTQAIQRLNSTAYNLTKEECIDVLREMRDGVKAAGQEGGAA